MPYCSRYMTTAMLVLEVLIIRCAITALYQDMRYVSFYGLYKFGYDAPEHSANDLKGKLRIPMPLDLAKEITLIE